MIWLRQRPFNDKIQNGSNAWKMTYLKRSWNIRCLKTESILYHTRHYRPGLFESIEKFCINRHDFVQYERLRRGISNEQVRPQNEPNILWSTPVEVAHGTFKNLIKLTTKIPPVEPRGIVLYRDVLWTSKLLICTLTRTYRGIISFVYQTCSTILSVVIFRQFQTYQCFSVSYFHRAGHPWPLGCDAGISTDTRSQSCLSKYHGGLTEHTCTSNQGLL